jgi:hypothetical protein
MYMLHTKLERMKQFFLFRKCLACFAPDQRNNPSGFNTRKIQWGMLQRANATTNSFYQ